MNKHTLAIAVLFFVNIVACRGQPVARVTPKMSSDRAHLTSASLLIVPQQDRWVTLAAAPLTVLRPDQPRTLVCVDGNASAEVRQLIQTLGNNSVMLESTRELNVGDFRGKRIRLGGNPLRGSLRIAEMGWRSSEEVALAHTDDELAQLLAATLATHKRIPLLLASDRPDAQLKQALARLGTRNVLAVTTRQNDFPRWISQLPQTVHVLAARDVQNRLVKLLGPRNVRNLVVTRVADSKATVGLTSVLAPVLAGWHKSLVLAVPSSNARETEQIVHNYVRTHRLRPSTVTILADYHSIGTKKTLLRDKNSSQEYEFESEPCAADSIATLAPLGIGRIPFASCEGSSVLIARGFLRAAKIKSEPPRATLVADTGGDLKLCQTVSRATAFELRNAGVAVSEYYEQKSDKPEIRKAAEASHLIVYEGHNNNQHLLDDPEFLIDEQTADRTQVPELGVEAADHREVPAASATVIAAVARKLDLPPAPAEDDEEERLLRLKATSSPVLVLQSCNSLEEDTFRRFVQSGGVSLVGSVTPIHSASGSSFIKCFTDQVIYHRLTVGEALRDARNYFLCLQRLKTLRNHKEQLKSQRVALSFRLWGDPELHVFPQRLAAPRRKLVRASWSKRNVDSVTVSVPARRLPTAATNKYKLRMFAGSQAAGLVRKQKNTDVRRITPLYLFRLPATRPLTDYEPVLFRGEESNRGVFQVDPYGRYVYLLYYPRKETQDEQFELELRNRRPTN